MTKYFFEHQLVRAAQLSEVKCVTNIIARHSCCQADYNSAEVLSEGTDDYVLVLYRIVINVLRTPASAKLNFGVVNVEGGKLKFIG